MNKLILSILILAMVSSCKKETKTDELTDNSITDSVKTPESNEASETAIPFKKIELTPDEMSKMLAKKNNDTLYVTNFFFFFCGPCMMEMPHFKKKIEELQDKPVKFTFINIYNKPAWETEVPAFAQNSGLADKILLLDDSKLNQDFFENFQQWSGNNIPFTFFRKGDKTEESLGSMSEEMLNSKIDSFLK